MTTLPTAYQEFIAMSRYSRWKTEAERRETWEEVVQRYLQFFLDRKQINKKEASELEASIAGLQVMPSMRCLMSAGKALKRCNVAGFNCSYLGIEDPKCFDELMYILLSGTGVGYSVEPAYVNKLPPIPETFFETPSTIVVGDSKIGWATAFRELLSLLWAGKIPKIDYSKIRPAGAILKTFGGRASGPDPLKDLFVFTIKLFKGAAGRQFTPLEAHDLCCKIAEIVVVGGVRRSALISLSGLNDMQIRGAKSGEWWKENPQRALANNSAVYDSIPPFDVFANEWMSLFDSKSGERGIFSRIASQNHTAKCGRRDPDQKFGTNPCSEIVLREKQFCNLSTIIIRPEDTLTSLLEKVGTASILGTLQSTLVDFKYLRKAWKKNTEEEALLGVSMTGIMDHPVLNGSKGHEELAEWLKCLKEHAIDVNKKWAKKLKVNPSVAVTCVKPEGTVSQLTDTASGIHPRYSDYYIRRVRLDNKDPLAQFMKDKGFPCEPDFYNSGSDVFSFPIKSPKNSVTRNQFNCLEQLELWKTYQEHWCEHKPSITVYYKDNEFFKLGDWVYKNFNILSGVSFLPHSDHTYKQAPYEEITKEEFVKFDKEIKALKFDWAEMFKYEKEDHTTATQELACVGGACEV